MKILFLCIDGNSCRSLMAEAFMERNNKSLEVFSAGMNPDSQPDPSAIKVMAEIGIDISEKRPKSYQLFEGKQFDYLITICDGTKDKVPNVNIGYSHKIHLGFTNPRKTNIPETDHLDIYREVRDEIRNELEYFYQRILIKELAS